MDEPEQAAPKKGYWRKPNNWIRIITMALVAAYTGIQLWQTILLRRNNVATLQAFVYAGPTGGIAAFDAADNKTKIVGMPVPIFNSGNTATKNLSILVRVRPETS